MRVVTITTRNFPLHIWLIREIRRPGRGGADRVVGAREACVDRPSRLLPGEACGPPRMLIWATTRTSRSPPAAAAATCRCRRGSRPPWPNREQGKGFRLVEPSFWQSLPSYVDPGGARSERPRLHRRGPGTPCRRACPRPRVAGSVAGPHAPRGVAPGRFADDVAFCFAAELHGRVTAAATPANGSTPRVRGALPSAGGAVRGQSVAGFQDGRCASNASMSSACESVMPMSSRPSSSRHRV